MPESPPDIDYASLSSEELRATAHSVASEKRRLERLVREGQDYNQRDDAVERLEGWLADIHAELHECSCPDCGADRSPA